MLTTIQQIQYRNIKIKKQQREALARNRKYIRGASTRFNDRIMICGKIFIKKSKQNSNWRYVNYQIVDYNLVFKRGAIAGPIDQVVHIAGRKTVIISFNGLYICSIYNMLIDDKLCHCVNVSHDKWPSYKYVTLLFKSCGERIIWCKYINIYINYTKYILNCPGTTIFEYTNKKWRIPEKMVLYY